MFGIRNKGDTAVSSYLLLFTLLATLIINRTMRLITVAIWSSGFCKLAELRI
jgi:hypothetical protein